MPSRSHQNLTRRERQIMDSVYSRGRATVAEVLQDLPDAPSYSAVRAMMVKLEGKGQLRHSQAGARYVYEATVPRAAAQATALERVLSTFFDDSPTKTVAALLDLKSDDLSDDELDRLAELIDHARNKGR